MTLSEIARYVGQNELNLTEQERLAINDELTNRAAQVGRILDLTHKIDPLKGKKTLYGTRNHSSYTYKLRKAAGYSYP